MKRIMVVVAVVVLGASAPAWAGSHTDLGLDLGVDGGTGGNASLTFSDFARDLPFALRFGVGWMALNPGDADFARRVFVNEATNGTAEKHGHRWDMRLDARYGLRRGPLAGSWLCFGPRFSMYDGTFDFVGGNETFHVTTNQPGVGFAIERLYPMGDRTSFEIGAGLDWFSRASFAGHGATYNPDGTSVDPKEDFTYADADKAIAQPRFAPRGTLGLRVRLGH